MAFDLQMLLLGGIPKVSLLLFCVFVDLGLKLMSPVCDFLKRKL
jgi:hypothetical protein